MVSERDFDAASDRYVAPEAPVAPSGPALRGVAAAAAGRDFMVSEYGSIEAVEREIRRGRPRVGESRRGPSPVVRGALTEEDFAAFKRLEAVTGKKQADLVREGVHLLFERYKIAS
ncbi:hypothetical protein [Microbacterium resistens]|uniref:hypothetical protein n=1 Tax=Microbacterium resistens TaxID=156977 RepID=UPI000834BFE3|nr:hypothetical protein [Microbacterium resistens]